MPGHFVTDVAITLGEGNDLAISKDGRLGIIRQEGPVQVVVILGKATAERFGSLIENVTRLSAHAVKF